LEDIVDKDADGSEVSIDSRKICEEKASAGESKVIRILDTNKK
jgi:hypothetical protein